MPGQFKSYNPYATVSLIYGASQDQAYQVLDPIVVKSELNRIGVSIDHLPEANVVDNPVGGKPGHVHLYMISSDVDDIYSKLDGLKDDATPTHSFALTLGIGSWDKRNKDFKNLRLNTDTGNRSSNPDAFDRFIDNPGIWSNSQVFQNLGIVKSQRLGPAVVDGGNAITLVTFADVRGQQCKKLLNRSYNLHQDYTPDGYYPLTLKGKDTNWTWLEVLADIWSRTGIGGAAPVPSVPYTASPDGLEFINKPVLEAYDEVLQILGHRLVCDQTQYYPSTSFSVNDLEYKGTEDISIGEVDGNRFMMLRPWYGLDISVVSDTRVRTESDFRLPEYLAIRFRAIYPDVADGFDKTFPYYTVYVNLADEIDYYDPRFAYFKGFIRSGTELQVDSDMYAKFDAGFLPTGFKGEWDSTYAYSIDDYVIYTNSSDRTSTEFYKALSADTGTVPAGNPGTWEAVTPGTYLNPNNSSEIDARVIEAASLATGKLLFSQRDSETRYNMLLDAIPGIVNKVEHRITADGVTTVAHDEPWEFWESKFSEASVGSGGNATIGVVKGYLGQGWHEIEVYEDPTPPALLDDYYCGFGQATYTGGVWGWDFGLDQYESRADFLGEWVSTPTTYTVGNVVYTEAGDGTRTYWSATGVFYEDDDDPDQIVPAPAAANLNKSPLVAANAPYWVKLRCTSGPLPTGVPAGGNGSIECVEGVLLAEGYFITGCEDTDFSKVTKYKRMWTDGTYTTRSPVIVRSTCLPECDACPAVDPDIAQTLYRYVPCTNQTACSGCICSWEFNADCVRYEMVAPNCGYGCTCTPPTFDVSSPPADRTPANSASASTQAVVCNTFEDPANPCCSWDVAGACTPDNVLSGEQNTMPRALGAATGTIVKAFQSSSMTIPAGMNVTLMPMGDYYAIVDWEQNLQYIMIPLTMTCCPTTGNPIFDTYDRLIVQGYACNPGVADC